MSSKYTHTVFVRKSLFSGYIFCKQYFRERNCQQNILRKNKMILERKNNYPKVLKKKNDNTFLKTFNILLVANLFEFHNILLFMS